jgi:hypothetical protein
MSGDTIHAGEAQETSLADKSVFFHSHLLFHQFQTQPECFGHGLQGR